MMKLFVRGPVGHYEFENLARMFFSPVQMMLPEAGDHVRPKKTDDAVIYVRLCGKAQAVAGARLLTAIRMEGKTVAETGRLSAPEKAEYELCRMLYQLLCRTTGRRPPWGMLTGVRPVRLIHNALTSGKSVDEACAELKRKYDVSDAKLALAKQTALIQRPWVENVDPLDYSLYISIPFCPSRCSYCSFVSRTIENSRELVQPYVEALCRELEAISLQARRLGLHLKTVYMGGGTPTSLSALQLKTVMQCIRDFFPLEEALEYTVEAGRPDCTDAEKLRVIRELGADRISINPQTFQDSVLQHIGRRHSAQDILDCYRTAREIGHTNINMDLIAGLPSDTVAGFSQTLQQVLTLRPENVTVHTLTLKRASNLVIEERTEDYGDVAAMTARAAALTDAGYHPYYLYRQKGTLQNLENTGFCLPGTEGLYNIYIMEELHSIFSAGAGGVTKLKLPDRHKIERIFNFKYPMEYVRDFDSILTRKQGVDDFYGS